MSYVALSIYCPMNPYGYRYNVNHPKINELYRRYLEWKHIDGRPPTDAERREFERYIDGLQRSKETTQIN